jgi:hypothetical protein
MTWLQKSKWTSSRYRPWYSDVSRRRTGLPGLDFEEEANSGHEELIGLIQNLSTPAICQ